MVEPVKEQAPDPRSARSNLGLLSAELERKKRRNEEGEGRDLASVVVRIRSWSGFAGAIQHQRRAARLRGWSRGCGDHLLLRWDARADRGCVGLERVVAVGGGGGSCSLGG